jgi:putative transposase
MSRGERKAMIVPGRPGLSLSGQCRLLSISRSSFYYAPRGESPENLALMRRIDELFLKYPFYGSRQMARQLRREGVWIGRHRVRRLMRLMGLEAIYQAPRTSAPHPAHRIYPYLLRGMAVERPDQVWCADITYIPVRRGFLYLVAIMDWATRHVLAWRLSNTMDAGFCVAALREAMSAHGRPEIFNTDQSLPPRRRGAASSPAWTSPACSRTQASRSQWTGGAGAWTTSSSNACGGR